MERKPITPGVYPTLYRCVVCGHDIKKKELLAGGARQLDERSCVCASCVLQRQNPAKPSEKTPAPSRTRESASVATTALMQAWQNWHKEKEQAAGKEEQASVDKENQARKRRLQAGKISVADNPSFLRLVQVACEDKQFGARVRCLLVLPRIDRLLALDSLMAAMRRDHVPWDIINAAMALGDDAVARKILGVIDESRKMDDGRQKRDG